MNLVVDAEYESIRDIMKSRGRNEGQNKRIPVTILRKDKVDNYEKLDERMHRLQIALVIAIAVLGFIAGAMIF
jgi:hypothetical protein